MINTIFSSRFKGCKHNWQLGVMEVGAISWEHVGHLRTFVPKV